MFHIYSPALSVYLVSKNEGFKPKVLTQRIRKVKRATPEGVARNIESIWEERYSMVQSSGGDELHVILKITNCCNAEMLNVQTRYVGGAYEIVIVAKSQNMDIFKAFL